MDISVGQHYHYCLNYCTWAYRRRYTDISYVALVWPSSYAEHYERVYSQWEAILQAAALNTLINNERTTFRIVIRTDVQ